MRSFPFRCFAGFFFALKAVLFRACIGESLRVSEPLTLTAEINVASGSRP